MFSVYMELLEHSYKVDRGHTRERNKIHRAMDEGFGLSDYKFTKTYRLTKTLVRQLIEDLSPHIPPKDRSDCIDVETKVLATLAFLAVGSYQTMVGDVKVHSLSQPAVSRAIHEVVNAFNHPDVLNKFIKFPLTSVERDTVKEGFYMKYGFPGVVGCIDGTHVAIICPKENEERYFSRKQYHSLNCMIICDSNLQILAVDSSHPGSMHDAKIWEDNPLQQYLHYVAATSGELVHLLGDSGYSLRKSMMIPILRANDGTPEAHYYKKHVKTRNVVERCIGALKTRFRCLLVARVLHYDPESAAKIVNACCVLHNVANGAFLELPEMTPEEEQQLEEELRQSALEALAQASTDEAQSRRSSGLALQEGREQRMRLVQHLWRSRTY